MAISKHDKPYKPFDEIPQIKENVKHFLHLLGVYLLMIEGHVTNLFVSPCKENPEEIYVTETSSGNNFILDNLHTR